MTAKEMKRHWRPIFAQDPEKYYPSQVFVDYGFSRAVCPKCQTLYWRRTEKAITCGDSDCLGYYSFIHNSEIKPLIPATQEAVFQCFAEHFSQTEPAHTVVKRYPVVARWRDDCEFTAAGIQCYQPFCVTGEVEPPANPLVQSQFCLRFNDLDSIGLSGRHYSGFQMLGIQVFNKVNDKKYWKEGIIKFNLDWLVKMGINLDDVTLTADCWAGGGNLGPCVEYFIHGLEVGNMVFMEYKTFNDGKIEQLPVQVIDVGIGLERIPWLLGGGVTSYLSSFPTALQKFSEITQFDPKELESEAWQHFGKYSCLLNIDECGDIEQTWQKVFDKIKSDGGMYGISSVAEFKKQIEKVRDIYIVLDHLRSLMVAIQDGALPGNVGGGSNLRNVLRRVFTINEKAQFNISVENLVVLMNAHCVDLEKVHGQGSFPEFMPLLNVIKLEHQRWKTTDQDARAKVLKLMKKGPLEMKDWITAVTTYGLDPDQVSMIIGQEVPGDLYACISEFQERSQAKQAPVQYYNLNSEKETNCVYYSEQGGEKIFNLQNVKVQRFLLDEEDEKKRKRIVILEKTCFYPTSGGQQHDVGILSVGDKIFKVINVTKVGPCILHYLEDAVEEEFEICNIQIDASYRKQLMAHHTGAHVISASARKVLGPHVWQAGAKKSVESATLDITHFQSVTSEEQQEIEREANKIVRSCVPITKSVYNKSEAEKKYGFSLYQGGVVPGSTVRCVVIENIDAEACCGTHCENTGEIGVIKLVKCSRISDGVVRIEFVAGDAALNYMGEQENVIFDLQKLWGIQMSEIPKTARKFFEGFKDVSNHENWLAEQLERCRLQQLLRNPGVHFFQCPTESAPTRYMSVGELIYDEFKQVSDADAKTVKMPGTGVFILQSCFVVISVGDVGKATISKFEAFGKENGCQIKKVPLKAPKGVLLDGILMLVTNATQKVLQLVSKVDV